MYFFHRKLCVLFKDRDTEPYICILKHVADDIAKMCRKWLVIFVVAFLTFFGQSLKIQSIMFILANIKYTPPLAQN